MVVLIIYTLIIFIKTILDLKNKIIVLCCLISYIGLLIHRYADFKYI